MGGIGGAVADVRSAVGVSDHAGWAVLVTVGLQGAGPVVLDRRRVELVEASLPSQPHHHEGRELAPSQAAELIGRVRESALAHARAALEALLADFELTVVSLRDGPTLPEGMGLAEVLASIKYSGVADGVLYRTALADAARKLGLDVAWHARELGSSAALEESARELGPPWRKEHRIAAAAALSAVASHG